MTTMIATMRISRTPPTTPAMIGMTDPDESDDPDVDVPSIHMHHIHMVVSVNGQLSLPSLRGAYLQIIH